MVKVANTNKNRSEEKKFKSPAELNFSVLTKGKKDQATFFAFCLAGQTG